MRVLVGVVGAAWLTACTSLRMSVPADVESESEVYEAADRSLASGLLVDESFRIGPFAVQEVDRNGTKIRETSHGIRVSDEIFFRAGKEALRGGYTFRIVEDGEKLSAECRTFTDREKVTHFVLESTDETARLRCDCEGAERVTTLDLRLAGREQSGTVKLAGQTFEVTAVWTANSALGPAEPVGFRVDGAEGPAGAVEVVRPGRIWLSKRLGPSERRASPASSPACCSMWRTGSGACGFVAWAALHRRPSASRSAIGPAPGCGVASAHRE